VPRVVAEYKVQAKARIVAAAHELFHKQGLAHTSMEDIARAIGVSKGALYLYFPTKLDLLLAIQSRAREEALAGWEEVLTRGDVAEGLARPLDRVLSGQEDPALWLKLVGESRNDPDVRKALEVDQRDDARIIRQFLEELQARGRIPPMEDPAAVTDALIMVFHGAFARIVLGDRASVARAKLLASIRVVLGLAPGGEQPGAGRRRSAPRPSKRRAPSQRS
jgi:AcrR family transcriptional regulator